MAAELRLGVSFDLVYFRQQLQKLSQIAASEFAGRVKLTIDKRDFQRQFNAISRDLKINVNDSQLIGAKTRLTNLNKSIATFRRASTQPIVIKVRYEQEGAAPAGVGAQRGTFRQRLVQLDKAQLSKMYEAAGAAGLVAFEKGVVNNKAKLVTALNQVGEDTVSGLLNGLKSENAAIKAAAKTLGNDLIKSVKNVLGIASPSREFKKIGEDSGEGLEQGLRQGIGEAARVGVQEIRELYRKLRQEARSGTAQLQALMLGSMAGIVQLPGGRQQRNRLQQTGAAINTGMVGPALGNIRARQSALRGQQASAAAATPAFMAALPMMFGMGQRELIARLTGLHGQQYRAPGIGSGLPDQRAIGRLVQLLASARSGVGAGGGVSGQLFAGGGLANPGLISSGYIGRSALSPAFVNYPVGMPAAYASGFMGGGAGSYGMAPGRMQGPALPVRGVFSTASGSLGRFPSAGMMGSSSGMGSMGQFPTAGMHYPSSPLGRITAQSSMFGAGGPGGWGGGGGGGAGGGGGGSVPPGGFPSGGMMGPSSQLTAAYYAHRQFTQAVAQGMPALQNFQRAVSQARIPLAGAIAELGDEFGTAIKQVLLFGTAYKGLAFLTGLPGQAFNAAKALQTFQNQLLAVTHSSQAADRSFAFIDNLANRFNVPLQSARDGFVKLYASMEPAGFQAPQIENLFTGISKATATFGLSADQVDRVNYAFAQMASKGQIMSEELKGQLGDVLPGALALFAQAAGMSIPEFSKAMEDGAFKGKAMEQVLNNVADLMNSKFAGAAANASQTLQGQLNAMQNSMQRMYEAFAPIVDAFASSVFPVINTALSNVTQAVNAFGQAMQGNAGPASALTGAARQIYETMVAWAPTIKETAAFLGELAKEALQVVAALLPMVKGVLDFLNLPFVRGLAEAALKAGALVAVIQILANTALVSAIRQVGLFIGGLNAMATGMTRSAAQAAALRAGLIGIAAVAVIAGLDFLLGKLAEIHQKMRDIQAGALNATNAIRGMSQQEAFAAERQYGSQLQALRRLQRDTAGIKGDLFVSASAAEINAMAAAGLTPGQSFTAPLADKEKGLYGPGMVSPSAVTSAIQKLEQLQSEARYRQRSLNQPAGGGFTPTAIDLSGKDGKSKGQNAALQMADDRRKYEADLMKLNAEQAMKLDEMQFDHWKSLWDERFNYMEAGQNEWMKREIKFQRDLHAIEMRRIESVRKSQQESQKAQVEASARSYVAGGGNAMFGDTGRTFNAAGWVHGHFQNMNRQALVQDTADVVMSLLEQGVTPELGSGTKFGAGMTRAEIEAIVRQGIASHKPYASGAGAVDVFVPKGTPVPVPLSGVGNLGGAAGVSGNLPRGTQLMHLDPRSASGAAATSRARTEAKQDYSADLAAREALNAKEREAVQIKYANQLAQSELNTLVRAYVAEIAPVEQQRLENSLLQDRVSIIRSGAFGDQLDLELKLNEARKSSQFSIEQAQAAIDANNKAVAEGVLSADAAAKANAVYQARIDGLKKAIEGYLPLLREKTALERQAEFEGELSGLQRQAGIVGQGLRAGFIGEARQKYESAIADGYSPEEAGKLAEATRQLELATMVANNLENAATGIGDAFAQSFSGMVTGAMTAQAALGQMFSNVAKMFADMAAQMIAKWLVMKAIGLVASMFGGGQAAGNGAGASEAGLQWDANLLDFVPVKKNANGGVLSGGWAPITPFATGGIVSGPTLGLVGEGRFNEAVVPLPDGKSIPVQLGEGAGNNISTNIVVNVNNGQASSQVNGGGGQALGRELEGAVRSVILKETRPGGIIYNQR